MGLISPVRFLFLRSKCGSNLRNIAAEIAAVAVAYKKRDFTNCIWGLLMVLTLFH